MKKYLIGMAVLCLIAWALICQPNYRSTNNQNTSANQGKSPAPIVGTKQDEAKTKNQTDTSTDRLQWICAALKKPDWWVVIIAALTGLAIALQAREMTRATEAMKQQTLELAAQNRNMVAKERARLRVNMNPLALPDIPSPDSPAKVDFSVSISGTTDAFITETRCAAYAAPPEWMEIPELSEAVMFQIHGLPFVVPANRVPWECYAFWGLTHGPDDALILGEIRAGRMTVGIRGIIKYKDVFDKDRHTSFRYKWKYSEWSLGVGEEFGDWVQCGSPEENEAT